MAEPQVFEFILRDEGDPQSAGASPGSAARASSPTSGGQPLGPQSITQRQTAQSSPTRSAEPERFGQVLLDAIQRATRSGLLGGLGRQGGELLRPLVGLGQIIADFRRGSADQSRARPGAAATQTLPIAQRVTPTPQSSFTISQAVFNAHGARIVIVGGQVAFGGSLGGQFGGGRGGGGGIPRLPGAGPAGLPALPPVPRAFVDASGRGASAASGAAARAGAGAAASAGGQAAGGVASLGSAAASAILPLTALVVATGAVVASFRFLYRRSTEQAQSLANYDATLAAAQARAQFANVRQDIRSAQKLGQDLARMTDANNRTAIASTKILDFLQGEFLQLINPILEFLAITAEKAAENPILLELIKQAILGLGNAPAFTAMNFALNRLGKGQAAKNLSDALKAGDFYALFQSMEDLDIAGPGNIEIEHERVPIHAPGFGRQLTPPA